MHMAALIDEEPDRENGDSDNGWLQYVDVKPGANLKHALSLSVLEQRIP